MIWSPVMASSGFILAFFTHSGCDLSGISQLKKTKATAHSSRPLAAPNTKPSERSSAPTFELRIMSEIRTVMTDTTMSATKNTPAAAAARAIVSLAM